MSIVSIPRLGRLRLTNAHTQQPLATFDYRMPLGVCREQEAAVYRDTLGFAWGCIPDLLCDATVFGFHLEEASAYMTGQEPEYIPVTYREPLSCIQLVHTLLRYQQKLGKVAPRRPAAPVVPHAQRVMDYMQFATR